MAKSWFDTEDGRNALDIFRDQPEAIQVLGEATKEHLAIKAEALLGINVSDPTKDRAFIVAKAEYDGAQGVIRYINQILEARTKRRDKHGQ